MASTLKDIATIANVSTAAVSLALNGKAGVSKETADRIIRIARDLNYSMPRGQLDRLQTVRFIQINKPEMLVDPVYNTFIAEYLRGLSRATKAAGYKLEINTFSTGAMDEVIDSFAEDSPAGAVVLGAGLFPADVERLATIPTPTVFIDVCYDFIPVDFVDMNNIDAVFRIVSYLRDLGHRRIGIVQSTQKTPNFAQRETGFREALARFGLPFAEDQRFVIPPDADGAAQALHAAILERKNFPTALFCVNDTTAYNAVQALKEYGLLVPDDVSVIGFDNLPASEYMEPPLTTINVAKDLMGERAFYLLMERVRLGMDKPAEKLRINGSLVERRSVRPIA